MGDLHFHPAAARWTPAQKEPAPTTPRWRVCVGGGTSSNCWGRPVPHGLWELVLRQAPDSLRLGSELGRDAERWEKDRHEGRLGGQQMAETLR